MFSAAHQLIHSESRVMVVSYVLQTQHLIGKNILIIYLVSWKGSSVWNVGQQALLMDLLNVLKSEMVL